MSGSLLDGTLIQRAARFGYLGVEVFFVISGFVIPLALAEARRQGGSYRQFFRGRFLRLYPAFAVAALLTLGLWVGAAHAPGFRGEPPVVTLRMLISNLTLSCDISHGVWLNPAFWTLAIEAQYYVLLSLTFAALTASRRAIRFATCVGWIALSILPPLDGGVFIYGAVFALGLVGFLRRQRLLLVTEAITLIVLALIVMAWKLGPPVTLASGLALTAVLFARSLTWRPLVNLGTISYSLYLLHVPIGGRAVNLGQRFASSLFSQSLVLVAALAVSIACSMLFYHWVELPLHRAARQQRTERARLPSATPS